MLKCESKVRYKREVEKVTIIEFYDKSAIENVAGALLFKPEKVVFVGDDQKKMKAGCARYEKILSARGIQTEFFCRSVNRKNLREIVCALSDIVASYDDCVFDLTGGEELCLVAVGIVMKLFEGKVKCHRFNFNNDTVKYLDSEGKICKRKSVDICQNCKELLENTTCSGYIKQKEALLKIEEEYSNIIMKRKGIEL